MIQYLIGAGIGYLLAQIENESKAKLQTTNATQPQLESQKNEGEDDSTSQPETKKVEFVAKSRGKKKPNE